MKLKYYLRGIGIGIIATAVTLGVSLNKPDEIEKVIPKEKVLAEMQQSETQQSETQQSETQQSETQQSETQQSEMESSVDEVISETETQMPTTDEEADQMIEIVIQSGEGSNHVSKKLAEVGLVESASVYDQFLCTNGYDKKLTTGSHMIPKNATDEEIAKKLCSRN